VRLSATFICMIKALVALQRGTTRLSGLLMLVLCLSAQPVLAALGVIHDFSSHHDSALSIHGEHSVADQHSGDDDHRDDRDPLHTLLHFGHCCGHASGFIGSQWVPVVHARIALPRPWPALPRFSSVDLTNPFRPPIPV
jgi:hypothetical protein